ncbi:MAG: flagellar FlbD family protein [Anaerolineaceae bacterium]|nr:flagellar FlbD family protein [Anaerolineaceae bacterium]
MIKLTKFNGRIFYLNAELVRSVESTPDTVITLISGDKLIVKDSAETVVEGIIDYQQKIHDPERRINKLM